MISRISISNYALIEHAEISLGPGLTIITGDTGAGKSMLLGALRLLTAPRADVSKVTHEGRKTVVEAEFEVVTGEMEALLDEYGVEPLDDGQTVILRREVTQGGRLRAFVNDSPVNANALVEFASRLIDIHSQHNNLLISQPAYQLRIIDALAGDEELLAAYRECYHGYVAIKRRIMALREEIAKNKENEEFIKFRLEALRKLKPRRGEQADLEKRLEMLSDSASIGESLSQSTALLARGERSVMSMLSEVQSLLSSVNFALFEDEEDGNGMEERLESVMIELRDISDTLHDYDSRIDSDPAALAKIDKRLNALYDAQKRFHAVDEEELVSLYESLEEQYANLSGSNSELPELEKQLKAEGVRLAALSDELSNTRRETADRFAENLMAVARPMGMHNLKFTVELKKGRLTSDGADMPQFLVAFNKNQELMPIGSVASGGEISRLMLALKSIVAAHMNLPTVIFDEVDTGVSGDIASKMGAMMKGIASDIQVLAITHLPQVAAQGDIHFKVHKEDVDQSTVSCITVLNEEEREYEIARMLSGTEIDEAALLNARSLLNKK